MENLTLSFVQKTIVFYWKWYTYNNTKKEKETQVTNCTPTCLTSGTSVCSIDFTFISNSTGLNELYSAITYKQLYTTQHLIEKQYFDVDEIEFLSYTFMW